MLSEVLKMLTLRHGYRLVPLRAFSTSADLRLQHVPNPAASQKPTGDISSVFPSLSGTKPSPLPLRFAEVKSRLVEHHRQDIEESWERLLKRIQVELMIVKSQGSSIIPELEFRDIDNIEKRTTFRDQLRERGVAIIRGVVTEQEALGWKELIKRYIRNNPQTQGFPAHKPAVYELYWSPSQILARAHPNVLKTQSFLMSHWRSADKSALISVSHPVSYADRLRIRQPGDAGFALGAHVDAGSCERWEEEGYGRGKVYEDIFEGRWEQWDPWESSCRLNIKSDLYNSAGGCSMFRMFQGWLSMSHTGPFEGTLMVNPLFRYATAYFLLRPFFHPIETPLECTESTYLHPHNWAVEPNSTPTLQGAVPSHCQELNPTFHPHLDLANSMVHIPTVRPGDYVAWHCDTIHAVDAIHTGSTSSDVMYIPVCPLTETNASYLSLQRETFLNGTPGPDFPSSEGESNHFGRLTPDFVMQNISAQAQRAMGLKRFESVSGERENEKEVVRRANEILGFM